MVKMRVNIHGIIAALLTWVMAGGSLPVSAADSGATEKPATPFVITDAARAHWAFVPVRRIAPPTVATPGGIVVNPIDAFILARLQARGLALSPPASKTVLIRRVTLDLTGNPPTPAEVDAFLADPSPDAYEKVIDRLLASPHYGERWGRHWLDLARYGTPRPMASNTTPSGPISGVIAITSLRRSTRISRTIDLSVSRSPATNYGRPIPRRSSRPASTCSARTWSTAPTRFSAGTTRSTT